jgi:hypothetical protein
MPYVYEEIGGQPDDWDDQLVKYFDHESITGIVCQVKSGEKENKELFTEKHLDYCVKRLGFSGETKDIVRELKDKPLTSITNEKFGGYQIGKLLICKEGEESPHLCITLSEVITFLQERIIKYQEAKYAARHFFPSTVMQTLIDLNQMGKLK